MTSDPPAPTGTRETDEEVIMLALLRIERRLDDAIEAIEAAIGRIDGLADREDDDLLSRSRH